MQTICTFVRIVGVAIRLAIDSHDVVSGTKLPAFLTACFSMYVSIQFIQILGLAANLGLYKWPGGMTVLVDVETDRWRNRAGRYRAISNLLCHEGFFFRPFKLKRLVGHNRNHGPAHRQYPGTP
jgi:hypothetical protein